MYLKHISLLAFITESDKKTSRKSIPYPFWSLFLYIAIWNFIFDSMRNLIGKENVLWTLATKTSQLYLKTADLVSVPSRAKWNSCKSKKVIATKNTGNSLRMYIKRFENIKGFKLQFSFSINLCIKIYLTYQRINQERVNK